MPSLELIQAHIERLTAEVRDHKTEIARRKRKLHVAAAALADMQAMLSRLTSPAQSATGVEGKTLHGRSDERHESSPNPQS